MLIGELKGRLASAEWRARALTVAVLAAAWLFVATLNWPGHLSYDSVLQLLDARTGQTLDLLALLRGRDTLDLDVLLGCAIGYAGGKLIETWKK